MSRLSKNASSTFGVKLNKEEQQDEFQTQTL